MSENLKTILIITALVLAILAHYRIGIGETGIWTPLVEGTWYDDIEVPEPPIAPLEAKMTGEKPRP